MIASQFLALRAKKPLLERLMYQMAYRNERYLVQSSAKIVSILDLGKKQALSIRQCTPPKEIGDARSTKKSKCWAICERAGAGSKWASSTKYTPCRALSESSNTPGTNTDILLFAAFDIVLPAGRGIFPQPRIDCSGLGLQVMSKTRNSCRHLIQPGPIT